MQVQSRVAAINGADLHFRIAGDGPAVLLLHAGICDSRMWDRQIETFAGTHRVVAPDLRGYGRTVMPQGPYAHRDDVLGLLDHLGIERAAIVGASMSGRAAIDFALEHGERVAALVLVGAALSGFHYTDEYMLKMDEAAETALAARKFDDAAATELQLWVAGPKRSLDAIDGALVARVREMLMKSYETPMEARAERPLAPPAVGRLDEIGAPTLVLWGELDVADILTIGETLAKGIGGARQAVISGAAHLPNMERPGEFNRILGGFLSDLG